MGSISVSGTKAVMGISGNSNRISFVDISNINAPVERGSLTMGVPTAIRISPDGNYAYFIDYANPSVLHVANIVSLASPVVVANIPLDAAEAMNMDLRGSELFVGTLWGLYVFDISNPASPALTRSYSMSSVYGICAPTDSANQSGNVYVADSNGGIVALREQDIQAPEVFITTPWSLPIYTNATSSVGLGGGSDDDIGVTAITWSNSRGGSGAVSAPFDNWYVTGIKLYPGTNILTATAYDAAGNSGTNVLTVIYPSTNQNQTITFPAIANHTFGDSAITLDAAMS
jgi:hypothetical protein